jgi:hypothetical protein
VLNVLFPLTFIATAVSPVHLAIALSFIHIVLTCVDITAGPNELAKPLFQIIYIVALVCITGWCAVTSPFTFAVPSSLTKIACVNSSVTPSVLPGPVRLAILVLALVAVASMELISASSMFQTHLPLALVLISILPCVHTVSMRFRLKPFADVRIVL